MPPGGLLTALVIRSAVVALFPLALIVVGVVDRDTLVEVRALVARALARDSG